MQSYCPLLSARRKLLQELAPVSPLSGEMVAGFHRASPSTSLDKSITVLICI